MTQSRFFEFKYGDVMSDRELPSVEAAADAAQAHHVDVCDDVYGEAHPIYDSDYAEIYETFEDKEPNYCCTVNVVYESERSQIKEHGTWHKGAGGVL